MAQATVIKQETTYTLELTEREAAAIKELVGQSSGGSCYRELQAIYNALHSARCPSLFRLTTEDGYASLRNREAG